MLGLPIRAVLPGIYFFALRTKKKTVRSAREEEPRYNIQNGAQFVVVVSLCAAVCRCIVVVYVLFGRLYRHRDDDDDVATVVVVIENFCHLCISHPIQLHKREKETLPFEFLRFHLM